MDWSEQSGAHKLIKDIFFVAANVVFAMPALTSVLLLGLATHGLWNTGVWRTPSMLELIRHSNPRMLNMWGGLPDLAASVPVWLASLALTLLIFVWSSQKTSK